MVCFAAGLVRSLGALYAIGLPAALSHSFALAAINGALIADRSVDIHHGGGDTSVARSRQSAKLFSMTLGDTLAFGASTALELCHASQALVFAVTATIVALAALVACTLPLPHPACSAPVNAPIAAADPTAAAATPTSGRQGCIPRASALLCALVALAFMLPPTSFDVVGSFLYGRPGSTPLPHWLLSAMQITGMLGSLLGTCLMWRLDLPLRASLPLGAVAFALGSASQLWLFAYADLGKAEAFPSLLMQPVVQSTLLRCGLFPIYTLGASAADVGGEGRGFALVMAAEAAGGEVAGAFATMAVRALHIGSPPKRSWANLPTFIGLCAAAKLAAAPVALLLLLARDRMQAREAKRSAARQS